MDAATCPILLVLSSEYPFLPRGCRVRSVASGSSRGRRRISSISSTRSLAKWRWTSPAHRACLS